MVHRVLAQYAVKFVTNLDRRQLKMLAVLKRYLNPIVMTGALLTGLVGCGGGGGGGGSDNEQSGGIQKITVTALTSLPSQYNERQIVTLSLNTQGDDAGTVTYDWKVEFNGNALTFSGQNTQEISFTAPDVDNIEAVRVSVTLGLAEGRLLGDNRYFASYLINDLDPLKASSRGIIANGLSTNLLEVESLNTALIAEGTTWRLNNYIIQSAQASLSLKGEVYNAVQQITYFDNDISGDVGFRSCGQSVIGPFIPSTAQISCGGTLERKFYQSTSAFRVEEVCDGNVGFARDFTKLRDNQTDSFGQVALTLSSYNDFSTVENVCGAVVEYIIVSHEDENNDGSPDNSVTGFSYAELHGQYEGSPIKVSIDIDDVKSAWNYFLSDFFDPNNRNEIKFDSPALTKLNDLSADDGDLSVDRTATGIEVEVDAEFTDVDGTTVAIEGSFSLTFE
jgi:hypothetical protein